MRARMCGDASHNLVAVRILHKGVDGITLKFACRTQFKHAPPWESWGAEDGTTYSSWASQGVKDPSRMSQDAQLSA